MFDVTQGAVRVERPEGQVRYALKPLSELYVGGRQVEAISTQGEHLGPLMAIERMIVARYREQPSLTDAAVLATLKGLSMSPEAPQADVLGQDIQFSLRIQLSLEDHSRQEVKMALRKVVKSVERHTRVPGVHREVPPGVRRAERA